MSEETVEQIITKYPTIYRFITSLSNPKLVVYYKAVFKHAVHSKLSGDSTCNFYADVLEISKLELRKRNISIPEMNV